MAIQTTQEQTTRLEQIASMLDEISKVNQAKPRPQGYGEPEGAEHETTLQSLIDATLRISSLSPFSDEFMAVFEELNQVLSSISYRLDQGFWSDGEKHKQGNQTDRFFKAVSDKIFSGYEVLVNNLIEKLRPSRILFNKEEALQLHKEYLDEVVRPIITRELQVAARQKIGILGYGGRYIIPEEIPKLVEERMSGFIELLDFDATTTRPLGELFEEISKLHRINHNLDAETRKVFNKYISLSYIGQQLEPYLNKSAFQMISEFLTLRKFRDERVGIESSLEQTATILKNIPQKSGRWFGAWDEERYSEILCNHYTEHLKLRAGHNFLFEKDKLNKKDIDFGGSCNLHFVKPFLNMDPLLYTIDISTWELFRKNPRLRAMFGEQTIDEFHEYLVNSFIERLQKTPSHLNDSLHVHSCFSEHNYRGYEVITDKHIFKSAEHEICDQYQAIGCALLIKEAAFFKDARVVPYVVMNLLRTTYGDGSSNIYNLFPYLNGYFESFTEEQIQKVEQLHIPGLVKVINEINRTTPQYLLNFHQMSPELKEGIMELSEHYAKNGNGQEKYLGLRTAIAYAHFIEPDKLYEIVMAASGEKLNLSEEHNAILKKYNAQFLGHLAVTSKRGDYSAMQANVQIWVDCLIGVGELLKSTKYQAEVTKEAEHVIKDVPEQNWMYGQPPEGYENFSTRCRKALAYLRSFDSDMVQQYFADSENGKLFRTRIYTFHNNLFYKYTPETINLAEDLSTLDNLIRECSVFVERARFKDALAPECKRVIENTFVSSKTPLTSSMLYVKRVVANLELYFEALDEEKTMQSFESYNQENSYHQREWKSNCWHYAEQLFSIDTQLVVPFTRRKIIQKLEYEQEKGQLNTLQEIKSNDLLANYVELALRQPDKAFRVAIELSELEEQERQAVYSCINNANVGFDVLMNVIKLMKSNGIKPTAYLINETIHAQNRKALVNEWVGIIDNFKSGNFNHENELHRNLEYTRFKRVVGNEKVKRHIKNNYSFSEYLTIFTRTNADTISDENQYEIECVAVEAKVLRDYIVRIHGVAEQIGRKVLVVPNLSYGYLPVSPLVDELSEMGIEFLIGVKVGSSESHNNKEVVNSRLFKGYRTKIANEQPVIIVVDGTKNLVGRNDINTAARYPDSYQGYLNQAIAMNDAFGFTEVDYSIHGKSPEDMVKLRQTPDFQRLVDVYNHVSKTDNLQEERKPCQFGLWNTAGIYLIIRNYHEKIDVVTSTTNPEDIQGPAMIFCNVGLLDEQIPPEIKHKYVKHIPAYFDDSQKIIKLNFGFDNYGVRYINRLENEVKKAYIKQTGQAERVIDETDLPEIIRFQGKIPSATSACLE